MKTEAGGGVVPYDADTAPVRFLLLAEHTPDA